MAEIKRVDIYMGVVGQVYVDKETAKKNLEAAQKNVLDMREIIQWANEQKPAQVAALEKAQAAQTLAQNVFDQLSSKIEGQDNDTLHNQLINILSELNINDTDNNPYNGGNKITAQENVEAVNKLDAEINDIIATANDSLERRLAYVDEMQIAYDNALETFRSYLPEDEANKLDEWDAEEELLKARIQAVIDALAAANEISEAINVTSKDVITRAVDIILGVCRKNGNEINNINETEYQYLDDLNNLKNQLEELSVELNNYDYDSTAVATKTNVDSTLETVNNLINELQTSYISKLNDLMNSNVQVTSDWEHIQSSISENFNVTDFNISVDDIYSINEQIRNIKQYLTTLKNQKILIARSIERYEYNLSNIKANNPENRWPDSIEIDGTVYYKNLPGNPGEGWYQITRDYNGRTYYAWAQNEDWNNAPETIEIDGITYSKHYTEQPGDNYHLLTHEENGIQYYAWVENENGGDNNEYDYYLGLASQEQIQDQSYINSLTYNTVGVKPTELMLQPGYNVFMLPSSWGIPEITDDNGFGLAPYTAEDLGISNPDNNIIIVEEMSARDSHINISW